MSERERAKQTASQFVRDSDRHCRAYQQYNISSLIRCMQLQIARDRDRSLHAYVGVRIAGLLQNSKNSKFHCDQKLECALYGLGPYAWQRRERQRARSRWYMNWSVRAGEAGICVLAGGIARAYAREEDRLTCKGCQRRAERRERWVQEDSPDSKCASARVRESCLIEGRWAGRRRKEKGGGGCQAEQVRPAVATAGSESTPSSGTRRLTRRRAPSRSSSRRRRPSTSAA